MNAHNLPPGDPDDFRRLRLQPGAPCPVTTLEHADRYICSRDRESFAAPMPDRAYLRELLGSVLWNKERGDYDAPVRAELRTLHTGLTSPSWAIADARNAIMTALQAVELELESIWWLRTTDAAEYDANGSGYGEWSPLGICIEPCKRPEEATAADYLRAIEAVGYLIRPDHEHADEPHARYRRYRIDLGAGGQHVAELRHAAQRPEVNA